MDGTFRRIDRGWIGTALRLVAIAAAFFLCVGAASGQLVTTSMRFQNTGKPPVVFVNGYQRTCGGTTFSGTFGIGRQNSAAG